MSDRDTGHSSGGNGSDDPVADAMIHGLLSALAARERREAPAPIRRVGTRRLVPLVAAATVALSAVVVVMLVGRGPSASAASVMSMAIAHSASPGTRVYAAVVDPEGDGLGRGAIEGRVFLEGGPAPRMAAELGVGPLARLIRFGRDPDGAWVETPTGVRREAIGPPMLAAWLAGLDDRVLRMDAILERCSRGHEVSLTPGEGELWRLRAVRRTGEWTPIVEAEFLVRRVDGAVVAAWLTVESLGGARAEVTLELEEGIVATEADLGPSASGDESMSRP